MNHLEDGMDGMAWEQKTSAKFPGMSNFPRADHRAETDVVDFFQMSPLSESKCWHDVAKHDVPGMGAKDVGEISRECPILSKHMTAWRQIWVS